jgi:hypothetical protein
MHDENSFMATFEIGQRGGHKHKIHKSLLIPRKFLIFGQWMWDFIRYNVGSQLQENFQHHHARKKFPSPRFYPAVLTKGRGAQKLP